MRLPAACPSLNGYELYGVKPNQCVSELCNASVLRNEWPFCDDCTEEMREGSR